MSTTIDQPPPASRIRNRAAVLRYRQKNQRIDYVPASDVLAIIHAHRQAGLNNCAAGVIDALVRAGHEALIGRISGHTFADPDGPA